MGTSGSFYQDGESMILIDSGTGTPFIRIVKLNQLTGTPVIVDYELDGVTTFTPIGQPIAPGGVTNQIGLDGRQNISQEIVLGDYKATSDDQPILLNKYGTGSHSWANSIHSLSVTPGQYMVLESYRHHMYISGNPNRYEFTTFDFHLEPGILKMAGGYHTPTYSPPYDTYDGVFLVADGDANEHQLRLYNNGVLLETVPFTQWDNQTNIDWVGFNTFIIDYLWLGGVGIVLYQAFNNRFVKRVSLPYSGSGKNSIIMRFPEQKMRYEIRSTTGTGIFRPVCARVSTMGSFGNVALSSGAVMKTPCNANVIGTDYMVLAIQLRPGYEHESIDEISFFLRSSGANDSFSWRLLLNPTIASLPSPAVITDTPIQWYQGDTVNTVTGGYVLKANTVGNRSSNKSVNPNLSNQRILGVDENGVTDIVAAVVSPEQGNLDIFCDVNFYWR